MALLRRNPPQIVPCFGIVRLQFDCMFEIVARFGQGTSAQIERSKIVVSLRLVVPIRDHLLERFHRFVEITMLKKCDAIGEIVALEFSLIKRPLEWKCLPNALSWVAGNSLEVFQQNFCS